MVPPWFIYLDRHIGHIADRPPHSVVAVSPGQELGSEVVPGPGPGHVWGVLDDRDKRLVTGEHRPAVELDPLLTNDMGCPMMGPGGGHTGHLAAGLSPKFRGELHKSEYFSGKGTWTDQLAEIFFEAGHGEDKLSCNNKCINVPSITYISIFFINVHILFCTTLHWLLYL